MMGNSDASGQDASPAKWAIVVHGGAGSDPDRWSDEKRTARRAGLERALRTGTQLLQQGASALDTVESVIQVLEDDAAFNAGRGAVRTTEGGVELDASIMDGSTLGCGAVAGVTTVKNPISLARRVMTHTKHVLLAGDGAEAFAKTQPITLVDPSYFLSHRLPSNPNHDLAKQTPVQESTADAPTTAARSESTGTDVAYQEDRRSDEDSPKMGTVGCVVLDQNGNLAAGTSTGGTPKKLPGRIGDSPIIGAGTYANNDTCAVSGTGVGEEYIRHSVAYDVSAQMRYAGKSVGDAVSEIMRNRLRPDTGGLIVVTKEGEIEMQHNTKGMSCAAADSKGRFEIFLALPNRNVTPQTR